MRTYGCVAFGAFNLDMLLCAKSIEGKWSVMQSLSVKASLGSQNLARDLMRRARANNYDLSVPMLEPGRALSRQLNINQIIALFVRDIARDFIQQRETREQSGIKPKQKKKSDALRMKCAEMAKLQYEQSGQVDWDAIVKVGKSLYPPRLWEKYPGAMRKRLCDSVRKILRKRGGGIKLAAS